jgi:hypothetical protein
MTELGVIRVCAQLPLGSRPPGATADALLQFRVSSRGYLFWPDAVSPAVMLEVRQAAAARQGMDRYLLGLARPYGGQVVTCDQALAISGGADVINLLGKGLGCLARVACASSGARPAGLVNLPEGNTLRNRGPR